MRNWLSFWNAETRRFNEPQLRGKVVWGIYVPWAGGRVSLSDRIYCVGIEEGALLLITRVAVAKFYTDPNHRESVLIDGAPSKVKADYKRRVPVPVVRKLRYLHRDDTEHSVKLRGSHVVPSPFQGLSSLRELSHGAAELDAVISPKSRSTAKGK